MGNRDLKPDEISMEKWFRVTELIVEQGREIHERAEVLKLPTDPSPLLSVDHPSPSAMKQARLALTALDADAEAEILREGQD
jgi:hypothetical protein